jgi:putative flippase GtrA
MRAMARRTHERHGEKLRFLVVGAWNTAFSLAVLWILDRLIPYDQSSLVQKEAVFLASWVISITHNLFTFKLLVFKTRGNWLGEYLRMYVVYAATFAVQSVFMLLISEVLGWSVFWATVPTVIVVTIVSYFGHKHFTFRQPEEVFEQGGG